jgi:hypothetical protein
MVRQLSHESKGDLEAMATFSSQVSLRNIGPRPLQNLANKVGSTKRQSDA